MLIFFIAISAMNFLFSGVERSAPDVRLSDYLVRFVVLSLLLAAGTFMIVVVVGILAAGTLTATVVQRQFDEDCWRS